MRNKIIKVGPTSMGRAERAVLNNVCSAAIRQGCLRRLALADAHCFIVFFRAAGFDFASFDDPYMVYDNPNVTAPWRDLAHSGHHEGHRAAICSGLRQGGRNACHRGVRTARNSSFVSLEQAGGGVLYPRVTRISALSFAPPPTFVLFPVDIFSKIEDA
jgi:hypothetical protein